MTGCVDPEEVASVVTGFQLGLATTAAAIAALVTVTLPDAEVETENCKQRNFCQILFFFTIVTQ